MSSFDRILPIIYSLGRISIQEGDRQLGFSEHPPHLRSLIVGLLLPYHGGMPLVVTRDLKRGWIRLLASGRVNIDEMLGVIATMRATARRQLDLPTGKSS